MCCSARGNVHRNNFCSAFCQYFYCSLYLGEIFRIIVYDEILRRNVSLRIFLLQYDMRGLGMRGLFNGHVTLSCLYGKFHWLISRVYLSFQPHQLTYSTDWRIAEATRADLIPTGTNMSPTPRSVQFRGVTSLLNDL